MQLRQAFISESRAKEAAETALREWKAQSEAQEENASEDVKVLQQKLQKARAHCEEYKAELRG